MRGRNEQEAERARARVTADELAAMRLELLQRQKEVEQMTTLSLKGDATITEYVAALKVRISTSSRVWVGNRPLHPYFRPTRRVC